MRVSVATESGELDEVIHVQTTGAELDICFNPQFLQDALNAIEDDEVIINFNGTHGPALIIPDDGNRQGKFNQLLLPLRV